MSRRKSKDTPNRINESLDGWSDRWTIRGPSVSCQGCDAIQLAHNGQQPFPHFHDCTKQNEFSSKYPWLELRTILRNVAPDIGP